MKKSTKNIETEKIVVKIKECDWNNFKELLKLNNTEAELDPTDKTISKYTITIVKEKLK